MKIIASIEDDEVMPIKRGRPSKRSWHTSMRRCSDRRPPRFRRPVRRRSSRSTTTGCRSVQTSLYFSLHQEWSGGFARVLASGKPSVASRRRAVQIALECVKKGRPNQLVDDDRGCEGRAATGRFRKAGFVSTIRRRYFFLPDDLTKRL